MNYPMRERFFPAVICITGATCLLVALWGCAPKRTPSAARPKPYRVNKKWYQPISNAKDFRQTGIASWYGPKFHGRKTANGETYDMHAMEFCIFYFQFVRNVIQIRTFLL